MYVIIVLDEYGSYRIAPGHFTRKQAHEWLSTWDHSFLTAVSVRVQSAAQLVRLHALANFEEFPHLDPSLESFDSAPCRPNL